jgi:hypothetical protein
LIKQEFLKKQMDKARSESRTPDFLRRLTFLVVDKVLTNHYKKTYSMKCLQSSLALSVVLNKFQIGSKACVGELCISQVFVDDTQEPGWNGFWGDDHHVWLYTEYGDLVDLSVKYLHEHPLKTRKQYQVPAIWWSDITQWPHVIRYLQQGPVDARLGESDMRDLENFKDLVLYELEAFINTHSIEDVKFQPILDGSNSMNKLHAQGNQWLEKSIFLQNNNIPHPKRIIDREKEIADSYKKSNN